MLLCSEFHEHSALLEVVNIFRISPHGHRRNFPPQGNRAQEVRLRYHPQPRHRKLLLPKHLYSERTAASSYADAAAAAAGAAEAKAAAAATARAAAAAHPADPALLRSAKKQIHFCNPVAKHVGRTAAVNFEVGAVQRKKCVF